MTLVHRFLSCAVLLGGLLAFSGCGTTVSSSSDQDSNRTLTTAANTNWVLAHWTSANGEKQTVLPPAPTLLIGGASDRLVPRASVEAIARIRPDWDHVMLDDCGHVPMLEHPRVVANAIDAWLAGPASWILLGTRSLAGQARAV